MKWIKLTYKVENWVSGTDDSVFLDVSVVIIFTGTNIKFCLSAQKKTLQWQGSFELKEENRICRGKNCLVITLCTDNLFFNYSTLSYSLYNTRALLIIFWCTDLKHLHVKEKNAFFCGNTNGFKLVSHADQQVNKTKTKTPRVGKLVLFFHCYFMLFYIFSASLKAALPWIYSPQMFLPVKKQVIPFHSRKVIGMKY